MFVTRLKNIRENLKERKLDAVFISSVSNITYLTGYANFSKEEREAYLIIGNNLQYIITDGRYTHAIKKQVPHFELFERSHQTPTEQLFKKLKNQIKILGIEEDNLTVLEAKLVKKHFKTTKHFKLNRSIKTPDEIKKIKKACKIGDLAFEYILKQIKIGVTEKEIANKLEDFIKGQGGEFSFPAIVAFGKNSAIPHHQTGQTVLGLSTHSTVAQGRTELVERATRSAVRLSSPSKSRSGREGLIVLLDFGVKWENYCSDMTRTVFFGKPIRKQQEMYEVALEAQKKAVDYINSTKQVQSADVDKVARDYIKSKGYPNLPHSLGHGIGLEVHEHPSLSPKSKEVLKTGMVFSIEPGIYIPMFGGVRIEDLYTIRNERLEQITKAVPIACTIVH